MMTYQMVGVADQNGRTYESKFGEYSKEDGFTLSDEYLTKQKTDLLWDMLHDDCWSLKKEKVKRMTKEEIEKELGYKIEIYEEKSKNKEDNPASWDWFYELFG